MVDPLCEAPSAALAVVGSAALAKSLGAASKLAADAASGGAVLLAALSEPAPIADALTLLRSCAAADAHLYIVTSGAIGVSESDKVGCLQLYSKRCRALVIC